MVFINSFSISRVAAYSFHALINSSSVNLLLPLTASSFSVGLVASSSFFAKEASETPIPDILLLLNLGLGVAGFGLGVAGATGFVSLLTSLEGLVVSFLILLTFGSNSVLELLLAFSMGFSSVFFLISASASTSFN